jgi:hypothetical protein
MEFGLRPDGVTPELVQGWRRRWPTVSNARRSMVA